MIFQLVFLAAIVRIVVPYALAALAGTVSERSGVVQIALEGMLLVGAFSAIVGADVGGSAWSGVLAGAAAGATFAAAYAVVVLWFAADPIVTGVAFNLLADALTRYLLHVRYDSASNSPRIAALGMQPLLDAGPLLQALTHPLVLLTLLCVVLVHVVLYKTVFGLRLRAVGERPDAAMSVGVDPRGVRVWALIAGGALAGLGGAYLAVEQRQFVAGMSAGRGYIALAAMIFGGWRPVPAVLACLLFGAAEALEIQLQTQGGVLPAWAVQMLPYVLTILVLALSKSGAKLKPRGNDTDNPNGQRRRKSAARAPAALGKM